MTAWSGDIRPMSHGAVKYMITERKLIMAIPSVIVMCLNPLARFFLPAPRLWPTSEVAASPMPYPGM